METRTTYLRRKQLSGRTKRRMALVAFAFVACALALFAYVSAHLHPAPANVQARATVGNAPVYVTVDGRLTAKRRIYPFSVVPGGVLNRGELLHMVRSDDVVARHYAGFSVDTAHVETVAAPRAVHVSYRRGDKIYWTAKKVMLKTGETVLSDGKNLIRGRCGNRISDAARFPIEPNPPKTEVLDSFEEAPEAPAPMGLSPVLGSSSAQTFPATPGNTNGIAGRPGTPFAQFAALPPGGGSTGTETPPLDTTPVTPPTDTPPVVTPPTDTPPTDTPPTDTPPTDTPPVVTPPTPPCTPGTAGCTPLPPCTPGTAGCTPLPPCTPGTAGCTPPCTPGTAGCTPPCTPGTVGCTPPCTPGTVGCTPPCTPGTAGCTPPCTPGTEGCSTCTPGTVSCPPQPVPEPGSLWLIAIAGGGLLAARRRGKPARRRPATGPASDPAPNPDPAPDA